MDTDTSDPQPTVEQLLVRVMQDVDVIAKDDRNSAQGYRFRGVDATMNTVGPILRKHGLICVPVTMHLVSDTQVPTQRGGMMRAVTVSINWNFIGPTGDVLSVETLGESADTGDKAIPKATSVAYRELWLKTLCVPTEDPVEDVDKNPPPQRAAAAPLQVDPAIAERLRREIGARRSENGYRESWGNVETAYQQGDLSTVDYEGLKQLITHEVGELRARAKAASEMAEASHTTGDVSSGEEQYT